MRPAATLAVTTLIAISASVGPRAFAQGFGGGPSKEPSGKRSVPAETTAAAVVDKNWKAPRTSWGQPSLEGVWSTDDMRSIPLNRPAAFGTHDTMTPEEFKQRASRDEGGKDLANNRETFLRNEWGIRTFGYTSLVIDPADGKIPELTAAAKARAVSRGTFGSGPFNTFDDFTLYDRCITRGLWARSCR